ncbi:hypothetical protein ABMX48_36620 [Streptomyces cavourensis]
MSSRLAARGGGEVIVAVLELEFQVDDLLFEGGDPGFELFGVVGTADAGLAPDLVTEDFAEALFEPADLGGEAGTAGVGGSEVGLERCAGDGRAVAAGGGGGFGGLGVDLGEEVAVAIEEGAVDARAAGYRGNADVRAVLRGVGESCQDALAAASGVRASAFDHGLDGGVGCGHAGRSTRRSGRG